MLVDINEFRKEVAIRVSISRKSVQRSFADERVDTCAATFSRHTVLKRESVRRSMPFLGD